MKSYVANCYINVRPVDMQRSLFREVKGEVFITLNGYAIIPLKEYAELTGKDLSDMIDKSDKEDKGLRETSMTSLERFVSTFSLYGQESFKPVVGIAEEI